MFRPKKCGFLLIFYRLQGENGLADEQFYTEEWVGFGDFYRADQVRLVIYVDCVGGLN